MLIKESIFLKELIQELPKKNLKVLNFGSQSSTFLKSQPYIYENIIKPTLELGHTIENLDIRNVEGADIVGDIFDDVFFAKLKEMHFDVIFVFNLLEHVSDLELMVARIQELISKGKYIIFSGPYKYPVHLDPIDNGFRPDVQQVTRLFTNCNLVRGEAVVDYTYKRYLFSSPKFLLINFVRLTAFFYKYNKWRKVVIPKYRWLFKKYEVTCVLLEKNK